MKKNIFKLTLTIFYTIVCFSTVAAGNFSNATFYSDLKSQFKETSDYKDIKDRYAFNDNSISVALVKDDNYAITIDLKNSDNEIVKAISYYSKANRSFETIILELNSDLGVSKLTKDNFGKGEALIMNSKGLVLYKFINKGNTMIFVDQHLNKNFVATPAQTCVANQISAMGWLEYGVFLGMLPNSMLWLYVYCVQEVYLSID